MTSTAVARAPARSAGADLRAWLRRLGYFASEDAASRRDLRIDLLRGFAMFAMVIDHLGGESWLYAITGGNRFYVSAAEGFIFISGMVLGQVYQARLERDGFVEAMTGVLHRAWTLYLATLVLTLIFSALFLFTDVNLWTTRDFELGIESFEEIVVASATLHFTYHGTDILAMYALLLLGAPLLFLLLSLGRWQWVLLPSWTLWAIYQAYPEYGAIPWYIRHSENFPLAAWQVLFVTGLVLGYQRQPITAWFQRWSHLQVALVGFGLAITLGLISLFWSVESGRMLFPFFDVDPNLLSERFFKISLRPWRLIAFAAVSIVLFTATTDLWRPIRRATGWLLLPLGQNALYVFIMHFFLILIVFNLLPLLDLLPARPSEATLNPFVQLGVVLVLWVMVKREFLFKIVPR